MLDHRVYRAAFLPAVVVLMLAAFSLTGRPAASTTRVAPDAFDAARAAQTIGQLAEAYPNRRPGAPGDLALAERLERAFASSGFAREESIRTDTITARTVDGRRELRTVVAEREGLSSRRIVVLAHRDALADAPPTTLAPSAVQLELARVLADRDLRSTIVLASVSGGTGGYAGALRAMELIRGPIEAVLVLGDLGSDRSRRPWVVPWAASGDPAPHALRRTVEAALRTETGQDPGTVRALAQWARRAVPLTVSEQGVVGAQSVPAVLISTTGELGPRPGDELSQGRLRSFGRSVLRSVSAIEGARPERDSADPAPAFEGADGIVLQGRLLPGWAIRISVLALLLPALLAAVDAFFRVRRRGADGTVAVTWAVSLAVPFLLAWLWLRGLGLAGIGALPAPAPPGIDLTTGQAVALGSVVLVLVAGLAGLRPLLLRVAVRRAAARRPARRAGERRGEGAEVPGAAAAAAALVTSLLVLGVWTRNAYAAAVLLPAAHLWLLVPAPESRLPRPAAFAAVLAGLLGPVLVLAYFVMTLDLGIADALRLVFDVVAGGEMGLLDALAVSLLAGSAIAALLAVARRPAAQPPPGRGPDGSGGLRTRGPGSYAGPGSLGGTESALRR